MLAAMESPNKPPVNRDSDKFMLRLPDGMRDRIGALAKESGRSMNAEIVARLERSLNQGAADYDAEDVMALISRITAESAKHGVQVKVEFLRSPENILEVAKKSGHLPPNATLADLEKP